MNPPSPLIGSSIPPGPHQVDTHCALKLGNLVLTALPRRLEDALAVAHLCRERQIYLCWSEFCFRGTQTPGKTWGEPVEDEAFFSRAQLEDIYEAAGPYYFGRYVIGEIGGMVYWPKDYLPGRELSYTPMPAFDSHAGAASYYTAYCRDLVDQERDRFGGEPFINVESSLLFKYQAQSGLGRLCLEVMPGDPELMHAAIRGTARAYNLEWGTHIAMGWYGGVGVDELFQKRWRVALGWSYLCGADFILPESGHYGYNNPSQGIDIPFDAPEMQRMRRTLREFVRLATVHRRPAGGPKVRLGLLHGQHDGTPGLWNPFAWGQYHAEHWEEGPAERGWRLFDQLYRREAWFNPRVQGNADLSGNPPLGQVDVVPAEADAETLHDYSALLCPGWNTMTPDLYERLLAYVRRGGHLIMFLSQLRTNPERGAPAELFRDGDVSDLFGVRIRGRGATDVRGIRYLEHSLLPAYRFPLYREQQDPVFIGRYQGAEVAVTGARILAGFARRFGDDTATVRSEPFLVENRVGDGTALLVLAWNDPGDEAMREFCADLLRTVSAGEQGDIALAGSDRIRYAMYEDAEPTTGPDPLRAVYVLNTDLDNPAQAELHIEGEDAGPVRVDPAQLRTVFSRDGLLVLPQTALLDIERWHTDAESTTISCFSPTDQLVQIRNLTASPKEVTLNGRHATIDPRDETLVELNRRTDPARAPYFAPDFLDEPDVHCEDTKLPY